jgi:alkanesulfonate monooxygenase SsuD/methylene tetrahydromethanopterin reductase-like flavin-dependent oxidoreductase (luciferase family)
MDIGIGLPNSLPAAEGGLFVDWAKRAEARGFSTLATIGRVAYPSYEEIGVLCAAAAVTSRIRLLTNILLAPTRNFVLLAKEAATLDQLSGGRFTLGVGVGGRPDDYQAADQDMATRGRRLDAGLELMHRAWRGELVAGAAKPVSPRPVRDDRVPMLIGGNPPLAASRAARWGVGWTIGGLPPEMAREAVEATRAAWADAGTTDGSLRIVALTYFSLGAGTEDVSRANLRDYYDFMPGMVELIVEGAARGQDDVRARLRAFEETGIDELIFDPTVPSLDQVDLLADAVLDR